MVMQLSSLRDFSSLQFKPLISALPNPKKHFSYISCYQLKPVWSFDKQWLSAVNFVTDKIELLLSMRSL